jgi:hypothetical protein
VCLAVTAFGPFGFCNPSAAAVLIIIIIIITTVSVAVVLVSAVTCAFPSEGI